MEIRAVDIGFGFTKTTDGRSYPAFKSIFGEATDIQYRSQLLRNVSQEPYLHLEVDGELLFVGDLAERQSKVRAFTLDQHQFISKFAKILALSGLSLVDNTEDPINLVTGLPVVYYRQHLEELSEILQGRHTLRMIDPQGNVTDRAFNIENVKVVPQPFGSVFDKIFNDIGKASEKRFLEEKIGIIDIGFRTVDYTICDRTRYSQRGSLTTDAGIAKGFAMVAAALQEKSGIDVELYRLHEAITKGSIKIRGKVYDLTAIVEHAFKQLATAIATEVDRAWADDWDIDCIVLTGGGSHVLGSHIKPLLEGEVIETTAGEDARLNNVRGYWKYGQHLWNK